MLRSLLAALLGAVASSKLLAGSHEEDFARFLRFVKDYDRTYKNTDEFSKKFEAFRGFLKLADERNKANRDAGGKDVHGITKFADLTQEEFRARYLMKPGYYKQRVHSSGYTSTLKSSSSLGNVDWRKQGAMTAVNNQGECGGCWAISATQALESFGQIQHQYGLTALSFQETCSCTYDYNGCNGGNPQDAYKSIVRLGGLISSEGYPWVFNCTSCEEERASASGRKYLTADGYTNAPRGSLQSVLKNNGPPAVAVTAEFWNTWEGKCMQKAEQIPYLSFHDTPLHCLVLVRPSSRVTVVRSNQERLLVGTYISLYVLYFRETDDTRLTRYKFEWQLLVATNLGFRDDYPDDPILHLKVVFGNSTSRKRYRYIVEPSLVNRGYDLSIRATWIFASQMSASIFFFASTVAKGVAAIETVSEREKCGSQEVCEPGRSTGRPLQML
eukprot:g82577.t1